MAFESIKAEIDLILTDMQARPEDRHELYLTLMEKIGELRAFGLPVPDDLIQLERALEAEFAGDVAEARGRSGPTSE